MQLLQSMRAPSMLARNLTFTVWSVAARVVADIHVLDSMSADAGAASPQWKSFDLALTVWSFSALSDFDKTRIYASSKHWTR